MNAKLRAFVCSIAILLLAGCMTPQQRAERMERDFGPQCRKLGHAPGSQEYGRCLQQLHNYEVIDAMQMTLSY
jgi:outer membrane biogenesis lipoprotein LolB